MHNSEISKIIGGQWQCETNAVKNYYTVLANDIRIKHAEENPEFRYAPRRYAPRKTDPVISAAPAVEMVSKVEEDVAEPLPRCSDPKVPRPRKSYI